MSPVTKRHLEPAEEIEAEVKAYFARSEQIRTPTSRIRTIGISRENHSTGSPAPEIGNRTWGDLVDRVRAVAHHARAIEVQARKQEQGVEALRERVRADFKLASERVREAEDRAAKAEARAAAAEERARMAENYFESLRNTIASEFPAA